MAWCGSSGMDGGWRLERDESYWQPYKIIKEPSLYFDGVPVSWRTLLFQFRVRERVETWVGLTEAAAFSITGDSSTVIGDERDNFESYSCKVTRSRSNDANGYTVTKTQRWTALYMNGGYYAGADSSIFTSTSAPAGPS